MFEFDAADHQFMARALRLAERGRFTAHPNPRVGCVLAQSGDVVGEGWHHKTGEAHAEINALAHAGDAARGSVAYVNLEPCCHEGRTPPCTQALIDAKVARVVVAAVDPNPKVAGAGNAALSAAGIDVRVGLLGAEAIRLNRGFRSRIERGRPFVQLKIATSLDGRTSMRNGESKWITGDAARRDVQRLRASSGAVLTGIDTVLVDDPSLTVRDKSIDNDGMQPLRVVLDSVLRMPPAARMLNLPGETLIFCLADENRVPLEDHGAMVVKTSADRGKLALAAVLRDLADRNVNDLLIEAGPTLAGEFLNAGLVDELVIYQAPHIMGSETLGMVMTPTWTALNQRFDLDVLDSRKIGKDVRITARPTS